MVYFDCHIVYLKVMIRPLIILPFTTTNKIQTNPKAIITLQKEHFIEKAFTLGNIEMI